MLDGESLDTPRHQALLLRLIGSRLARMRCGGGGDIEFMFDNGACLSFSDGFHALTIGDEKCTGSFYEEWASPEGGAVRKWRSLGGGGDLIKWERPGQEVEGVWRGTHDGRFGLLGTIEQFDGSKVRFTMTAILTNRLEHIPEGEEVRIVYEGPGRTKAGAQLKLFEVFVADREDESE